MSTPARLQGKWKSDERLADSTLCTHANCRQGKGGARVRVRLLYVVVFLECGRSQQNACRELLRETLDADTEDCISSHTL